MWFAVGGVSVLMGGYLLATNTAKCREALRPHVVPALIGAAVGITMAVATYGAYRVLLRIAPYMALDTAHLYSAFRAPSAGLSAVALTPIILGEEVVWRHVVQTALTERWGPRLGVVCAALAYAFVLLPLRSPLMLIAGVGCGLVWSTLRATTGGLVAPLVAHLVWDAVVLIWLPLDAG